MLHMGKQVTLLCEANSSKEACWVFSYFVRAEDKGVRDWQGCDLRAGMQEDLHCELAVVEDEGTWGQLCKAGDFTVAGEGGGSVKADLDENKLV